MECAASETYYSESSFEYSDSDTEEEEKNRRMEKSYKSAVVIAPPLDVCDQIQKIRAEHDKAYERWMPHINMLYPFYENTGDTFSNERLNMFKHLFFIRPFEVQFTRDSIGYFKQGRRLVLWLKPLATLPRQQEIDIRKNIPPMKEIKSNVDKMSKATRLMEKQRSSPPLVVPKKSTSPGPIPAADTGVSVGLDALHHAFWTPENTRQGNNQRDTELQQAGLSSLRHACVGLSPEKEKSEPLKDNSNPSQSNPIVFTRSTKVEALEEEDCEDDTSESSSSSETSSPPSSKEDNDLVGYKDDDLEWLPARSDGNHPSVMYLQSELERIYPDLDDLSTRSDQGFQPHLTLGQFSVDYGTKFMAELKQKWLPVKFVCSEVQLISRKNQLDPFHVISKVPFAGMDIDVD